NANMISPAMTCAGLLGVLCGAGAKVDVRKAKAKDGKANPIDVSKDVNLRAGLQFISNAVGQPIGWNGTGQRPLAIPQASGKAFYYLWSLERVCVILSLDTIARKDWYNWGAEVLLANQTRTGAWMGEYGNSGADTCFALLFLKKANLAHDLNNSIRG